MSDIIDKLVKPMKKKESITVTCPCCLEEHIVKFTDMHKVEKIEQQNRKMLEALIEDWNVIESFLAVEADVIQTEWYDLLVERQGEIQAVIENITEKSWLEIEELRK